MYVVFVVEYTTARKQQLLESCLNAESYPSMAVLQAFLYVQRSRERKQKQRRKPLKNRDEEIGYSSHISTNANKMPVI